MMTCVRLLFLSRDVSSVATLDKVSLDIAVVLGATTMPIHQALRLGRGAIIELDASEDDEVKILVNNFPVAKGTVVVSGNRIAVEIKEMLPRGRRPALISGRFRPNIPTLVPAGAICYMRAAPSAGSVRHSSSHAAVAELVDALALRCSAARRGGSSPFDRTIFPFGTAAIGGNEPAIEIV